MAADAMAPLIGLAAATGFIHTLAGPDHYVPFVAIARSRAWSWPKTACVTALCGVGHVLSSVILGAVGIAAGVAISRLESIEAERGDVAAWLMIAFGLVYMGWGLRRAVRSRPHQHSHSHLDGEVHEHEHAHDHAHLHVHAAGGQRESITPWVLFIVFAFGPCEVLIPQLMYPAAVGSPWSAVPVVVVFGCTTIATMLAVVLTLAFGLKKLRFAGLERHVHLLAGATVSACGALILCGL
ncbi:MAG: sulfite exporter TauE/SafE family protein [Planctomycetes bacterium]|nr:sulfite exporter TauE/SafE family protein [Planctomycetota bacterium]